MSISLPTTANDAYKQFHPFAYHPDVTEVYANYTNRSGKHSNIPEEAQLGGVVHVGVQYFVLDFIMDEFNKAFFEISKEEALGKHARIIRSMLGKEANTERLAKLHDLGYLPLHIKSLPEGTIAPYGVATVTVVNTLPGFEWLTNSIETVLSCEISGVSTSATTATAYFNNFLKMARRTGVPEELIQFMGHDFSMRGMIFGRQGAYLSAFGHLCSGFVGTDTTNALPFAEKYYNANLDTELVGASVDATEHSVTCSWLLEGEIEFVRYLMTTASPNGILSVVADTWDFWRLVTEFLPQLKEEILARDGKLVIRPDSGDPVEILCGKEDGIVRPKIWEDFMLDAEELEGTLVEIENSVYKIGDIKDYIRDYGWESFANIHGNLKELQSQWLLTKTTLPEIPEWERKGLVECLYDIFGGGETDKGFKTLHEKIGAIYGDSITIERQLEIFKRLEAKGFAPEVVLGIGSYTYQYVTRDTHGSAVKATSIVKDGKRIPIFKDPKTDKTKKSAKGLLYVGRDEAGNIYMEDDVTEEREQEGLLQSVFLDGKLTSATTLDEIRKRVREQLEKL